MDKDVKEKVESAKETAAKVSDAAKETAAKVSDTAKEKAKQAQEYLQSEEFQNKKNEAVKNTKSAANKFFKCSVSTDEEYAKAQKRKRNCVYGIVITLAVAIFFFPFFGGFHWLRGIAEKISSFLQFFSIISRILTIPICVVFGARYYFANKAMKEYKLNNPSADSAAAPIKKLALIMAIVISFVSLPIHHVMEKADDKGYEKFYSGSSSASSVTDEKATDFEITGGSSCVNIISARNYSVICPNCGLDSGALGTSSVHPSRHYVGETEDIDGKYHCRCGEYTDYYITVDYN